MYQGQILNSSTTRFVESADISMTGVPALTVSVGTNEINFTVTPTITASAPDYTFQLNRPSNQQFGLKVNSNDLFEIKSIKMWTSQPVEIVRSDVSTTATYDSQSGKYIAILYATTNNSVAWTFNLLLYEVKLRRGNSETLWHMDSGASISGTFTTWYYFPSNHVSAIHGE